MDEQKSDTGTAANSTTASASATSNAAADAASSTPPVTEPAAGSTADLARQLAEAKAETSKNLEGWQRTAAEFANFRKRSDKERSESYQMAAVDTLKKILPVIDDFDRAIQVIPADQTKGLAYDSLTILHRKLLSLLESAGIKVINPLGESFNPDYHEALGEDANTGKPSGQVSVVLQKGYVYGDKVLRAAMVRVTS